MNAKEKVKLAREWQRFCSSGMADTTLVRDFIFDSWQRSRSYGVDPYNVLAAPVSPELFTSTQQKNRNFIRISLPVIEKLYEFIEGSRSIIVLADDKGIILSRTGDPEYLTNAKTYDPGIEYSEKTVGTNGIGTSIYLGEPVQIWAEEHFSRRNHQLSCSAAPVRDPQGKVIGCLNLSCPWDSVHTHTLAMVTAAAHSIEQQLRIEAELANKTALLQEKESIFQLINEGVLTVNNQLEITDMNERARKMLTIPVAEAKGGLLSDYILAGIDVEKIIRAGTKLYDQDATLHLKNGILACSISTSPIGSGAGVVITLREAKSVRRMVNKYAGSKAVFTFGDIVGSSPQIRESMRLAEIAGKSDTNTLLLGESGTGKELFAQSIHNGGNRRGGPFIAINCGALPRDLIQSELFGYGEGAFTGARRQGNPGKFELADGGTIFLDEIGEMPLAAQVNLLRVVETKEVVRIGDKFARPVDVRIIAATNRSLLEGIADKSFREDLYYRLNVLTINLPPLRVRSGDVEQLVTHFRQKVSQHAGKEDVRISSEAMQRIMDYAWPGNIRELENVIERAVHVCQDGVIRPADLGRELSQVGGRHAGMENDAHAVSGIVSDAGVSWPSGQVNGDMSIEETTRRSICEVLRKNKGNMRKSAQELGISRSTLYARVKRHNLDVESLR